jgi:hypothetical protein
MSDPDGERGSGWQGVEHVQAAIDGLVPGGAIVNHLIDVMPGVQSHQAAAMFERLLKHVATSPDGLVSRIEADAQLHRVLWEAARAAADTELEGKIQGLALMASEAVIDRAKIDVMQLRIRTLAGLESLHVRAMRELEAAEAVGPRAEAVSLADLLDISDGMATALCADLLRLALGESGGMTFTGLHTSAKLSPYGEEILAYLRGRALGQGSS